MSTEEWGKLSKIKAELYRLLNILPDEYKPEFEMEKRKIQRTNNTLWVTIPMKYAKIMNLKKGDEVTIFWRKILENNNPLIIKV